MTFYPGDNFESQRRCQQLIETGQELVRAMPTALDFFNRQDTVGGVKVELSLGETLHWPRVPEYKVDLYVPAENLGVIGLLGNVDEETLRAVFPKGTEINLLHKAKPNLFTQVYVGDSITTASLQRYPQRVIGFWGRADLEKGFRTEPSWMPNLRPQPQEVFEAFEIIHGRPEFLIAAAQYAAHFVTPERRS